LLLLCHSKRKGNFSVTIVIIELVKKVKAFPSTWKGFYFLPYFKTTTNLFKMNTLPKTLRLIRPGQPVPNFLVRLNTRKTDYNTFRENKWTIMFTHPEIFIPTNRASFKAFLELQNFLIEHNAKLLGLNPTDASLTDFEKMELGKNNKIIIADSTGIVRSIIIFNEVNYEIIKSVLKEIQISDTKRILGKLKVSNKIKDIQIFKTDDQGFRPNDLFFQKININ